MAITEMEHVSIGSESFEVVSWRLQSLVGAGYGGALAGELARRTDIDLHRAIDLIRAGCPSGLAVRILV